MEESNKRSPSCFTVGLFLMLLLLKSAHSQSNGDQSDGDVLGTCHCTASQMDCDIESASCTSVYQGGGFDLFTNARTEFGCLVTKRYDKRRDKYYYFQQCIQTDVDYAIYCQPNQNGQDPDDPYIYSYFEANGELDVCCFTNNCNTIELLEELLCNITKSATSAGVNTTNTSVTSTSTSTSINTTTSSATELPPTEAPAYAIAIITVLSATVLFTIVVIVIVLIIHCRTYPFNVSKPTGSGTPTITMTVDSGSYGEASLNELLEDSGSGSGLPLLIQRSIAGQIALHELIGKGRFGEVWKGTYKGDEVAVKIFHTKEEMSWVHEVELYQTCLIRHPNILRFIAADNKDIGIQTQLWLITEFCEYGSLYDLLIQRTVDEGLMLKLCYTATCGLDHLHTEIVGTEGKPAIAHRDLKSRNILVKSDFSCCIGDLGLSLRYDRYPDTLEEQPFKRVGTKRYLAPEILDETVSFKNFEAYKRADIYSFGLVLWEVARRGECSGYAEEAQLPYYDVVPMDPSFEDMKKAVVIEQKRPAIPNRWSQSEVFRSMAQLIQQCWMEKSEARLTTLRLKKNLANLQNTKSEKTTPKEEQS